LALKLALLSFTLLEMRLKSGLLELALLALFLMGLLFFEVGIAPFGIDVQLGYGHKLFFYAIKSVGKSKS
jgi:hypothetical protein